MSAVVSSIIRLSVFFDAKFVLITQIVFWTMIECSLGLIAACLPLLYGLARSSSIESVVRSVRSAISLRSLGSQNSHRSNASRTPGTTSSYTATVLVDKSKNESTTSHVPIVPEAAGSIVSA
ncbi:plasma membrane Pth11 protein [Rutstroemia sp. NJR-2017a BVV2]|nr:plasma membrane Pth11 protein [Rutstroemia sp. NJR-2017a BVV2]